MAVGPSPSGQGRAVGTPVVSTQPSARVVRWGGETRVLHSVAKACGLFLRCASFPVCLLGPDPSGLLCAREAGLPDCPWPGTSARVPATGGPGRRSERGREEDRGTPSPAPCFRRSDYGSSSSIKAPARWPLQDSCPHRLWGQHVFWSLQAAGW